VCQNLHQQTLKEDPPQLQVVAQALGKKLHLSRLAKIEILLNPRSMPEIDKAISKSIQLHFQNQHHS